MRGTNRGASQRYQTRGDAPLSLGNATDCNRENEDASYRVVHLDSSTYGERKSMTDVAVSRGLEQTPAHEDRHNKILFWGCFIALITTAFGFITRMFLLGTWATEFGLDPARSGASPASASGPFRRIDHLSSA
jgi:hypothetical protein